MAPVGAAHAITVSCLSDLGNGAGEGRQSERRARAPSLRAIVGIFALYLLGQPAISDNGLPGSLGSPGSPPEVAPQNFCKEIHRNSIDPIGIRSIIVSRV